RSELASCCDAVHNFIASQNNSPLGSNMSYEVDSKKTILITEDIFKMLPVSSPLSVYPFKNCAVVGNGGILKNSSCGAEIDSSDFVFRCNLPPTTGNISKDVGNKTNLVTVNPSIIAQNTKYVNAYTTPFDFNEDEFCFSITSFSSLMLETVNAFEEETGSTLVPFSRTEFVSSLKRHILTLFLVISNSLFAYWLILLYGFWPFSKSTEKIPISHHYYDNQLPKPGFHAMPKEYNQILQLHGKGILKLQFGKCESD
ncbi:SIA8F sialyltransferase, partial [Horornis vulcanius]|nr:SIA8F sialyltransferase [Horornis vulcanius]